MIIELLCSNCYFLKNNCNHKILQINDEESLKAEKISLDSSSKEYDNAIKNAMALKITIEKELDEIKSLYDKVNNQVTESYKREKEKLIKKENEMKKLFKQKYENIEKKENEISHKLETEKDKVVNLLSKFLEDSKRIIETSEHINKDVKSLDKDDKNILIDLSFISEINKNQKEMEELFKQLMGSIKISYQEKSKNVKYDEYYFNGIQIPKEIEFGDITLYSFKVFWRIDKIHIINIDNNEIKFRVEIRKKDSNEKFTKVYEGKNTNYLISNLDMNTNYEIRICSIYNNLIGSWSEIKNVKTLDYDFNCDSNILKESNKKNEFLRKIFEWSHYRKMELIYRGTKDGTKSTIFHNKCDNIGPTICLYKNNKGNIFGGYASIPWTCTGNGKSAPDSFIFTLTNIYNTEPIKCPNSDISQSITHNQNYGPTFHNDIFVENDFLSQDSYSSFPSKYQDILGKGKSIFTGDINNNNNYFKIREIEVFKLFK